MSLTNKLTVAALGAVATYAAQKGVHGLWTRVVGEEPPDPHDPEVHTSVAVAWFVASGIGLAVAQLLVNRFASQRYQAPPKRVKVML
ncbi:MAG: DUF4235 domain-containing protein [Actinomycetia bacterium]|nr:DUF4235 domain-containing protein [Actinomycetes bacterium]